MQIKPLRSELKIRENSIELKSSEIIDFRTMDTNYIIDQLEDSIKLRETSIDKRLLRKSTE